MAKNNKAKRNRSAAAAKQSASKKTEASNAASDSAVTTTGTTASASKNRSGRVASLKLAWAGLLIIIGVALWWTGRLIAAFQWDTIYYPRYFLVQDLGARTCAQVVDGVAPRTICSPGHTWYSLGAVVGGLCFVAAGIALGAMYRSIQRTGTLRTIDARTALILSIGAVAVGVATIVQGSVDTIMHVQLVDTCFTIVLIVTWLQALWVGIQSLRHQPLMHQTIPVFNTWAAIISLILVAVSIGAFGFYVASPAFSEFGLYQRIALEAMALWGLMLAAALTSTRFATDDPQARSHQTATVGATEDDAADAAWQFAPESAASTRKD